MTSASASRSCKPPLEAALELAQEHLHAGRAREAARALERFDDESGLLQETLIFCLDRMPETTAADAYRARRAWWDRFGAPIYAAARHDHDNDRDPERPLRIGYVSGDFRMHSANFTFSPVVLNHSPAVDVVCYSSCEPEAMDAWTALYAQGTDLRDIHGMTDEDAAAAIRADRIDILVDLAGFSNRGRLRLFCRKPAPVQVTAWGYAVGTGLDTIDAIFGDPVAIPLEEQPHFAERIVHLPSIVPYMGQRYAPAPARPPCLAGEPFTFGSFSQPAKLTTGTLTLWGRLLEAAPESRLLLRYAGLDDSGTQARILEGLGVARERVIFEGLSPHPQHLAAYQRVDLALDPQIGGAITSLEALWMGVPVVTMYGDVVSSRVTASILTTLGLEGFVAGTEEEYLAIAAGWTAATSRFLLAAFRRQLRGDILKSPLVQGYVAATEDAYRTLWREWCARKSLTSPS